MKFITTVKKGNSCHSDMSAIMANTGFSGVTLTKYGMKIYIPQSGIRKDGMIKKVFNKKLKNMTVADAIWLNKKVSKP